MYLKVTAYPDSKTEKIEKVKDCSYKIWIKEPAENNQANKRILEIVKHLPESLNKKVRMISGHQKPSKKFELA